jgi:hypothetical protein
VKEKFKDTKFTDRALALIDKINLIVDEYMRMGYDLTARQVHYQFVSRNWYLNTRANAKALEGLISDARLAGLVDWDAIRDRGRVTHTVETWGDIATFLQRLNEAYRRSKWKEQRRYVEVMVEKQALEGVLLPVCQRWEVPFTANKGYSSSSSLYERGKFLQSMRDVEGKEVHVIYLGDHDPSGIDMTRDVQERLEMFSDGPVTVHRAALNRDQVDRWSLPENPAKMTDTRAGAYVEEHGVSSWELDAIPPMELAALCEQQILSLMDRAAWDRAVDQQNRERDRLQDIVEELRG